MAEELHPFLALVLVLYPLGFLRVGPVDFLCGEAFDCVNLG